MITKFWRSLVTDWQAHVDKPMDEQAMSVLMRAASLPAFNYYFMLSIAAAIATFGLLADSAPAIIGAMIIAPFMAPLMSLAFGLNSLSWRLISTSVFSVLSGSVLVVIIAFVCSEFIGLRIAGLEVLNRTSPNLLDLGVAMAAGAAGAFANTRKSIINSIAGVAIAVALVPPLAVAGMGLALGHKATGAIGLDSANLSFYSGGLHIATGAFVLFLTNLLGIILVAHLVFVCHRYGSWKKSLLGFALLIGSTVLVLEPLNHAFYQLYIRSTAFRTIATLATHQSELFTGDSKLRSLGVRYLDDRVHIEADLFAPRSSLSTMQERIDTFQRYMSAALNERVEVEVDVVPIEIRTYRSSQKPKSKDVDEDVDEDVVKEIKK